MANNRQLSVEIADDQFEAVTSAVTAGEYASTGDVVRAALAEWQDRRRLDDLDPERAGQLWDEGIASGMAGPFDIQKIKRMAREKLVDRG